MHPGTLSPDTVFKNPCLGTSLVVQGLGICLPGQWTWGRSPGPRTKIPHAAGQLSPCTTTIEAPCSGACGQQQEKAPQLKSSLLSLQLEKARA